MNFNPALHCIGASKSQHIDNMPEIQQVLCSVKMVLTFDWDNVSPIPLLKRIDRNQWALQLKAVELAQIHKYTNTQIHKYAKVNCWKSVAAATKSSGVGAGANSTAERCCARLSSEHILRSNAPKCVTFTNTHIHKYKYMNTNTSIQILGLSEHILRSNAPKCVTLTYVQCTWIQIHKSKYTHT